MKKLIVYIVISLVFNILCLSYTTKDYTALSKYNSKYEFVDFNKYLKTITTKREKYYRVTEFVDSYMDYDNIKKHIAHILKKGIPFNYIIEDNKDTVCVNSIADIHDYYLHKSIRVHKGVCEDYTALFKHICKQNNLPCVMVTGYAKQLNEQNQTIIGPHAWIIADSIIIDPTFCDSYTVIPGVYKNDESSPRVSYVDSIYFDIDPTIAAYTYFPATDSSQFTFNMKYNTPVSIQTNVLVKDKFLCALDISKPILTKIHVDFEWFLTTPYITHKYLLSRITKERVIVYKDALVKKFFFFTRVIKIKQIEYLDKEIKFDLIDLQPYKTVYKKDVYYEYGLSHINSQIYIRK